MAKRLVVFCCDAQVVAVRVWAPATTTAEWGKNKRKTSISVFCPGNSRSPCSKQSSCLCWGGAAHKSTAAVVGPADTVYSPIAPPALSPALSTCGLPPDQQHHHPAAARLCSPRQCHEQPSRPEGGDATMVRPTSLVALAALLLAASLASASQAAHRQLADEAKPTTSELIPTAGAAELWGGVGDLAVNGGALARERCMSVCGRGGGRKERRSFSRRRPHLGHGAHGTPGAASASPPVSCCRAPGGRSGLVLVLPSTPCCCRCCTLPAPYTKTKTNRLLLGGHQGQLQGRRFRRGAYRRLPDEADTGPEAGQCRR